MKSTKNKKKRKKKKKKKTTKKKKLDVNRWEKKTRMAYAQRRNGCRAINFHSESVFNERQGRDREKGKGNGRERVKNRLDLRANEICVEVLSLSFWIITIISSYLIRGKHFFFALSRFGFYVYSLIFFFCYHSWPPSWWCFWYLIIFFHLFFNFISFSQGNINANTMLITCHFISFEFHIRGFIDSMSLTSLGFYFVWFFVFILTWTVAMLIG